MTDLLDRIPAPIRSLWKAEIELRRGLWASIINRGAPNPHYGEARRHWDEALQSRTPAPAEKAEWGGAEHVATTVEQDSVDEAVKKPIDPDSAPRF